MGRYVLIKVLIKKGFFVNILVFNCGSSSQNYKVFSTFQGEDLQVLYYGKAHRVGVKGMVSAFIEHHSQAETKRLETPIPDHPSAANMILDYLEKQGVLLDAIGHRFVHGGRLFQQSTLLDETHLVQLKTLMALAPIHNPNSMSVIEVCRRRLPSTSQYVTFDTAFHAKLPEQAIHYTLPQDIIRRFEFRKYGFHGLSYQIVTRLAADKLGRPLSSLNIVACHLGTGGSSVAALKQGQAYDTSMGYSPLAGLVMSTRCGDIDPYLTLYLVQSLGYSPEQVNELYNKRSGLLGLSGTSSDLRDIQTAASQGDERAILAREVYSLRLKSTIAAYLTLLGGADALVFTDDIGVQNPELRLNVCKGMQWAGVYLDEERNLTAKPDQITDISAEGAAMRILTVPTDEERVIASEGVKLLAEANHVDH